jgi:thiamine biosynthesis lipoprotein
MRIGTSTATVRLSCDAIGTHFDLLLRGDDPLRLRAAGEDAVREIDRVDRLLNPRRRDSHLARINACAALAPVAVAPPLFRLLERCLHLGDLTEGAFDITSGPAAKGRALARQRLQLDADRLVLSFTRPGVAVDLGGAARGYAIDRAMQVISESDVAGALLHAGAGSIHALGDDETTPGWTVRWCPPDAPSERLSLRDEALSVCTASASPAVPAAALVVGPHSFECGVLAAALLLLGPDSSAAVAERFPGYHVHLA